MNFSRIYQGFKDGRSRSSGNDSRGIIPTGRQKPQSAEHSGLASLDSGLRRAATGILPSRRIQDFLSINDGGD